MDRLPEANTSSQIDLALTSCTRIKTSASAVDGCFGRGLRLWANLSDYVAAVGSTCNSAERCLTKIARVKSNVIFTYYFYFSDLCVIIMEDNYSPKFNFFVL